MSWIKRAMWSCLIWIIIHTRIYVLWSRLHQFLFQRKRAAIPAYGTLDEVMAVIRKAKWREDPWWMLWDAFSHPEYAYREFLETGYLGDCDDFAAFSASCLQRLGYPEVKILSTQWLDDKQKFHGHNVCLYNDKNNPAQMFMISNGFTRPLPVDDVDFASRYWAKRSKGERLAWCLIRPDLKKILGSNIGK